MVHQFVSRFGYTTAALCVVALGCGSDGGRDDGNSTAPTSISVGSSISDGTDSATSSASGDTGTKLDVGAGSTGSGVDTNDECAAVSETADVGLQPADIIVVVDNSGSMSFEAGAVQNNMNAFSSQIFLANIDAHVVLISAYTDDDAGICVAPPLGSGGCPADDNNPPLFTHIGDGVGSNNAFDKILQHYDAYKGVLRQTAAKHVLVVTDDDADMNAATFAQMFTALDPSLVGFKFHAIAAPEDPYLSCLAGTSCCATSAAVGQEYMDLVQQTGGVFGNLCDQEFQPIFDELAMQVIMGATLSCEYDIPPPPDGEEFNKDEVNVEFDDGGGNILEIGRVDNPAECANVTDGWYYDNPDTPTKIIVCPQTCDKIQGFNMASVSIKFGCATIPAG